MKAADRTRTSVGAEHNLRRRWMIYGANGYTGRLIAQEAVRRGHTPILAGRNATAVQTLADQIGLPWIDIDLNDSIALTRAVGDVELVVHAAGPFVHTSAPMIGACLASGAHYIDITGEIPVFEQTFEHDRAARERGIALLSGAGFDVVPSDCLGWYVTRRLPDAIHLEVAINALGRASAGTTKSALELMRHGGLVRRNAVLIPLRIGVGAKTVRFSNQSRLVMPIPWGDLSTAYRTTGVPNITTYLAVTPQTARLARWFGPPLQRALRPASVRRVVQHLIGRRVRGPSAEQRQAGRSYVWAQATSPAGDSVQAWLETAESYQFTAGAVVRAVEQVWVRQPRGAITPAGAFGADFVLEIPGSRRFDRLP